jgi:hypothetical protein
MWSFMVKKTLLLVSAMLMLVIPAHYSLPETRSEAFPTNHIIQDLEPGFDEQWELDVAQADNGKLFAVWSDTRRDYADIRFSNSTDGSVWGDGKFNDNDVTVNDDSGLGPENYHPTIAVNGQNVLFAVWVSEETTTTLRMSRSTSLGNTWNRSWEIETNGTVSEPYLRWCDSGLVLCYVMERPSSQGGFQKDIMFARSTDGGRTFTNHTILNDDGGNSDQLRPRMVAESNRVAVVWEDYRDGDYSSGSNPDVYFCHSSDGGRTFSENIKANDDPMADKQVNPDLAYTPSGDLIIVFQESRAEGWRIQYSMAWTSSPGWEAEHLDPHQAVVTTNTTRMDQSMPRVSYVDGSFALAWSEIDTRAFMLIRAGYIIRVGEPVRSDHIVDDSITLGEFGKTPGYYYAQMDRYTSSVLGRGSETRVFWIDYRTDPTPDNGIREDADPYTATAFPLGGAPEPPLALDLRYTAVTWNSVRIEWNVSGDIDFNGYFLTYGKGTAAVPDINRYNESIPDRARNYHIFTGLSPDTVYQFRMMVRDQGNLKAYSKALDVLTGHNIPPRFDFIEPDGQNDECDSSYTIRYMASDPEDLTYFELNYDTDQDPLEQVPLTSGYASGEMIGEYIWNTTGVPDGAYTINATLTDSVNAPRTFYSYSIIVDHPEDLPDLPTIKSVEIEGGKDTAYADCNIKVVFSTQVSPVSVSAATFFVLDRDNQEVPGILSIESGIKVSWMPRSLLLFGAPYTLTVTSSVTDLQGNLLDGLGVGSPSTYRLLIRVRPSDGEPQIRFYIPQGSGIRLRPDIQVGFDLPMDRESMDSRNVSLTDPDGTAIPLTFSYDDRTLILSLSVKWPLTNFTDYEVHLKTSVRSEFERGLAAPHEWSFETGGPDMLTDTDSDGVPDDLDWFPNMATESKDSDRDGLGDNADPDDDSDLIPDTWELRFGLDPFDPTDANADPDGDGLNNLEEYRGGTEPNKAEPKDNDPTVLIVIAATIIVAIAIGLILYGIVRSSRMKREREMRSFYDEE